MASPKKSAAATASMVKVKIAGKPPSVRDAIAKTKAATTGKGLSPEARRASSRAPVGSEPPKAASA